MSNWNPDAGLPLSAMPISVVAVEETANKAWAEFLAGWFDGNAHQLRGASVVIPNVDTLSFQESPVNPSDGLYLQVTTERPADQVKRLWPNGQWMVTERVKVNFWFRAKVKTARQDGENSLSLVRKGSDTLFAILSSNLLVAPLNLIGMTNFCPSPPRLIGGVTGAMRQVSLTVTYTYAQQEIVMQTIPDIGGFMPGQLVYIGGPNSNVRVKNGKLQVKSPDLTDKPWFVYEPRIQDGQIVWGQTGEGEN